MRGQLSQFRSLRLLGSIICHQRRAQFLVWSVAKPAACQDDDQHCWHAKADEGRQVQAGNVHCRKMRDQSKLWGIDAGVRQDRNEDASLSVIEDPGKEYGECRDHDQ